ncbi:MAG TPA: HD domain-containing protein [Panacibacter sp.]|nr:HD domain-containing protein [Panacibacter sp.]
MYKQPFEKIKQNILTKLTGLNKNLLYHSVEHTLDVTKQAERIAISENLSDEKELFLLKVASLYHDTGFLFVYKGHEEKSCLIFKEDAPLYNFSEDETKLICGIIMATKLPQTPATKLEEIICDADLDYLGREDFLPLSNKLRTEFLEYGIVKNNDEWEQLQFKFLTNHQFFTATSVWQRNHLKQQYLAQILTSFPG